MKTTEEKNRMIAEFMGFKMINDLQISTPNGGGAFLNELKYHSSWDWLMPVLKKIDESEVELNEDSNLIGDITHGLVSIDIQVTFEAVIEFIKWYNENK